MKVLYFAWLRERIGVGSEDIVTSAATVADLVAELTAREDRYAAAFADMTTVRIAVNQVMTDSTASLADAHEVAFFPPMTGG